MVTALALNVPDSGETSHNPQIFTTPVQARRRAVSLTQNTPTRVSASLTHAAPCTSVTIVSTEPPLHISTGSGTSPRDLRIRFNASSVSTYCFLMGGSAFGSFMAMTRLKQFAVSSIHH